MENIKPIKTNCSKCNSKISKYSYYVFYKKNEYGQMIITDQYQVIKCDNCKKRERIDL